uniref:Leucine-rich repeat-containing N-terminal plant-type domain-containing protein n=1 Tax=Setaria italica TaxID=4555 RepID=K3ZLC7_SETIT
MGTRKALRSNRRRAAGLAWPGSTRYRVTTKGGVHGHGGYHDEVPADPRPLLQNLSPTSIDLPTLTLALTASAHSSLQIHACNLTLMSTSERLSRRSLLSLNYLEHLDLSMNRLEGSSERIPEFLMSSLNNLKYLGNLTKLQYLDLSTVGGTNSMDVSRITQLRFLRYLNLRGTNLSTVSDWSLVTNMIPSLRKHFDNLLSSNSLKVNISSKWWPPFRVQHAHFSTCQMGPQFPAWIQWQVDIVRLYISSAGINDSIPHWFASAFSNAMHLDISNSQLSGGLPETMEIMSVEQLILSSNKLTGQIPPLPRNLTHLDISLNSAGNMVPLGPLPPNFGVPNLHRLFYFPNHITGRIPESICKCEALTSIGLANNLFEGELPINNSFSGAIPSSMQNCTMLRFLDLSGNKFSGRLKFKRLKFLRLSHNNKFSGNIPTNLTSLECLQCIDIADNAISGSRPRDLSNLKSLRQKYPTAFCSNDYDVEGYSSSLTTVLKGQQLNYGFIVKIIGIDLNIIDLSLNNLTGEIPEEIATLGVLVNLNLSRNHFSWNIRSGAMQSLVSLDLSRNELSGEIPEKYHQAHSLSHPIYDQNPFIYTGNIGLCGPPLQKNCSSTHPTKQGPGVELFYIGLGCGFIVGIWVTFFALLFKKRWRIAFFSLLDKLYDKAYVLVVVTWARLTRKTTAT